MDNVKEIPNVFMKDPVFRRLDEIAKIGALNDKERKAYNESLKTYRDNYAIIQTERREGRAEGRREGIEMIATNLISMGMPFEEISKATGLTRAQVNELRNRSL